MGELREDQAKGVCVGCVYAHIFISICKSHGFPYVYEQKHVYLSQCYENGGLVLLLV